MINCPNPECQAANPEGSVQCHSCETFLPHRYLWAAGPGKLDQLDERYSWQHQRVVLDTRPGLPPASPEPIPPHVWPYLMLAPHSLHVPQPYDLISDSAGHEILLLDAPAIAMPMDKREKPKLLPSLVAAWPDASPLRQLDWLWQVVGLWPDFIEQQVAGNLLLSDHLRVQGSLVRLSELALDPQPPTLKGLGASWKKLVPQAQHSIRDFLASLCTQLIQGGISTPEVLVACLDQAMAETAMGHQMDCQLSVLTDQGPSRKRNEDACYPPSGAVQRHNIGPKVRPGRERPLLLLVCDGIGGHDGGDVASQIAIATIEQELTPLLDWLADQPLHDPGTVTLAIEQAIWAANDKISQHNDQGMRQARDRMGTTLVMALIVGVHIYIAHIGDSRAYRISANSCQQITFDDDVAAREVRLGYGFYADVAHRPGTGALIQALGMGNSAALHITVQRLILDEGIVLLLCSDGLSDYDRVEQFWQTQLLPVLTGKTQAADAVSHLVQLANIHNGHDNVTVGIVAGHSQALNSPTISPLSPDETALPLPTLPKPQSVARSTARATQSTPTVISTAIPPAAPAKRTVVGPWLFLLVLVGFLGAVTTLTLMFFEEQPFTFSTQPEAPAPDIRQNQSNSDTDFDTEPDPEPDTEQVGIVVDELTSPPLTPGSYLQLNQPVDLLAEPQRNQDTSNTLGQLPAGTIVQILTRQGNAAGEQSIRWVRLKICSDLKVTLPTPTSLTSGTEGWIADEDLESIVSGVATRLDCAPD
ncbi:MAG: protein phosphatase 2C domain-containing protein [Cyanobacteria bacterium P01_B01_bin.77]